MDTRRAADGSPWHIITYCCWWSEAPTLALAQQDAFTSSTNILLLLLAGYCCCWILLSLSETGIFSLRLLFMDIAPISLMDWGSDTHNSQESRLGHALSLELLRSLRLVWNWHGPSHAITHRYLTYCLGWPMTATRSYKSISLKPRST